MRIVDIATWNRREHFEAFRSADLPFYNVNANVGVDGLRDAARHLGVPFTLLLVHVVARAIDRVENLRYRLRGGAVVLHERTHPAFAHIRPGEELFRMVGVEQDDDPVRFADSAKAAIEASRAHFDLGVLAGRDDVVFLSPMPWFSFTGIDHTLSLNRDDAIPRVTWGRVFEERGRALLPFNVQVNHMFVDGLHVARLLEALEDEAHRIAAR